MIDWIEQNFDRLSATYASGRLPHALIVSAPHGAGKTELARQLSSLILCQQPEVNAGISVACGHCKQCQLVRSGNHPDFLMLESDTNVIGVDLVRQATAFMQKTPQISLAKVVIAKNIEKLSESAANAFLKTLEEPTQNSYLLLTTSDVSNILPTIVSRCHIETISLPTGHALSNYKNSDMEVSPFSNFHQLPELVDSTVYASFCEAIETFSFWYLNKKSSSAVEKVLIDNSHGLRWLEWYIAMLQRKKSGVDIQMPINDNLSNDLDASFSSDELTIHYRLITKTVKTLRTLDAANELFTKERLICDIDEMLRFKGI